jgi:hypothetical protein
MGGSGRQQAIGRICSAPIVDTPPPWLASQGGIDHRHNAGIGRHQESGASIGHVGQFGVIVTGSAEMRI